MTEKIFDIIPPDQIKQTKTIKSQIDKNIFNFNQKNFNQKRKFFGIGLTSLIIFGLGIVFYFTLPRAKVIIWPKTEIFKQEIVLTLDKQAEQIDVPNKIIPAQLLVVEKQAIQEFPASKTVIERRKAEGIIRVYNAYSTKPLTLVPNTRFMSEDGKLFLTKQRITIPGAKRERGRLIPRYVDVRVRAAVAGEDHNIGPSTFSIPGLVGTPKFYGFYGKSLSPMRGGFKGEVFQITQRDLDLAKAVMIERLFLEGEKSIKNKIPNGFDFVSLNGKTVNHQVIESSFSAKAGDKKDSFETQVRTKSQGIIFKLSDVQKIARENILLDIQNNKIFLEDSLKIDYSFKNNNLKDNEFTMILKTKAKIFSKIDQKIIKENIQGKNIQQAEKFLGGWPEIIKNQVILWPFWVERIPQDKNKIRIELRF